MSVHDDGPPRWDKDKEKKRETPEETRAAALAPTVPATSVQVPATSAQVPATDESPFPHASHVKAAAEDLLKSYVDVQGTITSLDFKHALRRRTVELEPTPIISQEDVSRFLKRWFLDRGEKDGYAFREHAATYPEGHAKAGEPKPGKTVYNEYFYAPGARDAEKQIEAAVEALAVEGKLPEGGIKAFFKKMWSKMR